MYLQKKLTLVLVLLAFLVGCGGSGSPSDDTNGTSSGNTGGISSGSCVTLPMFIENVSYDQVHGSVISSFHHGKADYNRTHSKEHIVSEIMGVENNITLESWYRTSSDDRYLDFFEKKTISESSQTIIEEKYTPYFRLIGPKMCLGDKVKVDFNATETTLVNGTEISEHHNTEEVIDINISKTVDGNTYDNTVRVDTADRFTDTRGEHNSSCKQWLDIETGVLVVMECDSDNNFTFHVINLTKDNP